MDKKNDAPPPPPPPPTPPQTMLERNASMEKMSEEDIILFEVCARLYGAIRMLLDTCAPDEVSRIIAGVSARLAVSIRSLASRLSTPDRTGWRTYQRPEDKSGGHGVGWSPIIPYAFSVPQDWDEVPVSIADLGGTEIDLRFASPKEGRLFVIVAPVLRFADNLGDDATIERIGTPEKVINAFGPEIIGENVEGKVVSSEVSEHSGRKYYQFELEPPHVLITATAAGNRLYLFNVTGNGLQWKKHYKDLKKIADSFRVI
ncbi:mog1/PsbP/DUF1795-like photosystem II reactioncenter PsbP family protein [Striga asiatica]|uniref:Mog1/PsbP/DUF1795-like photosystem II reactioncenter PsbP family protein n=1 Tax=Striga asiatica TaxID=4170 RepID=A0A5A7PMZ3_STRAF|nr:mog1/PsbP/DUF1795-like photosystem II reactioncenter PsbP family protein [Striga asiatica]